jgi:ubiquinone/menaquinone biosynthesis C-methylase UbiE
MLGFQPDDQESGGSYDRVADLYDEAFADIRVREDEWDWVQDHIPEGDEMRLLDIGCGNGSLLSALSDRITTGFGVDASAEMINRACRRFGSISNLSFTHVTGPSLPVDDRSIDVVISFMSFRYLDWDPIMSEVRRVLVPGGRVLIVDMAAAPVRLRDLPDLIRSKLRHRSGVRRHPGFHRNLARMVSDPEWERMLRYNPVRAEHEYRWYLASRFPTGEIERLNVAMTHRLLAFDSGPVEPGEAVPQSYP